MVSAFWLKGRKGYQFRHRHPHPKKRSWLGRSQYGVLHSKLHTLYFQLGGLNFIACESWFWWKGLRACSLYMTCSTTNSNWGHRIPLSVFCAHSSTLILGTAPLIKFKSSCMRFAVAYEFDTAGHKYLYWNDSYVIGIRCIRFDCTLKHTLVFVSS